MLIIGLTGGIGSGKSTVAELFAKHDVPIIDADHLARELTEPQKPAWHKISDHFGPAVLKKDGRLNRLKLRELIFNDTEKRKWLEQLLHPLIKLEIQKKLQELKAPYCIVAIPLLIETGPYPFLTRILVVDTPPETQIERLKKRDQSKAEDLIKIIKTQVKREVRLAAADDVIHNKGKIEELQTKVGSLHQFYLSLVK